MRDPIDTGPGRVEFALISNLSWTSRLRFEGEWVSIVSKNGNVMAAAHIDDVQVTERVGVFGMASVGLTLPRRRWRSVYVSSKAVARLGT